MAIFTHKVRVPTSCISSATITDDSPVDQSVTITTQNPAHGHTLETRHLLVSCSRRSYRNLSANPSSCGWNQRSLSQILPKSGSQPSSPVHKASSSTESQEVVKINVVPLGRGSPRCREKQFRLYGNSPKVP